MKGESVYILGPCSAESREQVLRTAGQICDLRSQIDDFKFIFRAGVWKPRTSPHTFQGAGEEGLAWLQEVQRRYHVPVATEVATPEHVVEALQAGIDYLWIGARSSANPIVVQSIADTISNFKFQISFDRQSRANLKGLFIKNPVNADADLWLGNIERLEKTGLPVGVIHRGCGHQPCWSMAHTVRTRRPDIPMLLDPSHMSGDASQVPNLLRKLSELGLDGAMIEVHCCPEEALSDKKQQIQPSVISGQLSAIRKLNTENSKLNTIELNWLRAEIDELDDRLWDTILARMEVSERIGVWKQAHGVAPLQPERYQQIVQQRLQWAQSHGIEANSVQQIFDAIHHESLKKQAYQ